MERRLVYDSDAVQAGRCVTCGKRLDRCSCGESKVQRPAVQTGGASAAANAPRDGVVRIMRDKKGRGGKTVTLLVGVPGSSSALAQLTRELKQHCGTGGTLNGDVIEINGDLRTRLHDLLIKRGYKVKLAGG